MSGRLKLEALLEAAGEHGVTNGPNETLHFDPPLRLKRLDGGEVVELLSVAVRHDQVLGADSVELGAIGEFELVEDVAG